MKELKTKVINYLMLKAARPSSQCRGIHLQQLAANIANGEKITTIIADWCDL